MSEKIFYDMDFHKCVTPCKYRKDGYMVGSWGCKNNCRYCDDYNNKYVICNYNDKNKKDGDMITEKTRLTEEQALEIYDFAHKHGKEAYIARLVAYGYMEKPETALERAERLFHEWGGCENEDCSENVIDIVNAFREAFKEMQAVQDAAKGEK